MVPKRRFTIVGHVTATRSRRWVSIGLVLAIACMPCLTTQLIVRLHTIAKSSESVQTGTVVITVTQQGLEPATVTVSSGQAVTWHNVSGLTQTLRFERAYRINLPMIAQADPKVISLSRPAQPETKVRSLSAPHEFVDQVLGAGGAFTCTFAVAGNYAFSVANHTGSVIVLPASTPTLPPATPQATSSPASTPVPTLIGTDTPSMPTPTQTLTPSQIQTPTQTHTPSQTQTPTQTLTPSQTQTPTQTPTPSQTQTPTQTLTSLPTPTPTPAPSFAIVAAGDVARCSSLARAHSTANLIKGMPDVPVLALGDLAYTSGTDAEFQNCYHPTWGQFKDRTHPAPGNHEYRTAGAAGYYRYFGVPEYYAWDFAGWHFVSLNSEIDYSANSAQMNWLRADLAASTARCKLAYWHRPRYSSGASHGSTSALSTVWAVLQSYSVTLALTGHEHNYERFGPQDANGNAASNGIREFVVGTGGTGSYSFSTTPEPNSEFRLTNVYGVLMLELSPSAYGWKFIAIDGTIKDSGVAGCN